MSAGTWISCKQACTLLSWLLNVAKPSIQARLQVFHRDVAQAKIENPVN